MRLRHLFALHQLAPNGEELVGDLIALVVIEKNAVALKLERIAAGPDMDATDDWIVERARAGDIVVTADIPLASRCVKAGAG